ncbi:hypothetical protein RB653_008261 [Dictyostelium firmibasis]|uniref:Chromatin assembly factor 1 subunit A n=1 Tax=Dictyostelium firmibasis TaxID=79012 RepID=A0AAN7TSB2_9MYCE
MDPSIDMDSGSEDTEMKDHDTTTNSQNEEDIPNELPKLSTSTTPATPLTPKRRRLTEEEKQKREDEKKKREEDRIKREEEKKKKDEDKKKLVEERENEKKKRDEEKKKMLEEKEINRKKREEEFGKRREEKEVEKKKREEEAEKKRVEKKKKDDEIERKKEERKEEAERKKEEVERKREEAERLKEEEAKKQQKLTSFFAPIEAPIRQQKSNSLIQPIELPSNTQLYQYQHPTYSSSYDVFKQSISSSNNTIKTKSNQEKRDYFSKLNRGTQHGRLGQRNHRFKMRINSLPGSIMHHDLVSKLSVLKLLKFHDSFRPSYYGTYSKTSKQLTGKNPFKKDPNVIDYDYDSSDEWEEEKDDDQAEKITSADEKEEDLEEDEEDEEDRAWIDDEGLNEEEDTPIDNSSNINVNERVFSRKNKKKRVEEKKPIIVEPYFKEYPTIINFNVNNNNNNENTNTNNSLEFLKIFTIEPLDSIPIKLERPIDHHNSKEDRSFPIKALPTFLFIIKENKLSIKKLVEIFKENFPNISQRQMKDKLEEHCIYNHRSWSLKPESELILSQSTIDPLYPVPNIPKLSPTKKEKEKDDKEMVDISNGGSVDSPKSKSKKRPLSTPVQTNSLLNYFTKIEPQPSSQTQTPPLQSSSPPHPSPRSQSTSPTSSQEHPKEESILSPSKSKISSFTAPTKVKTDAVMDDVIVHIEPIIISSTKSPTK